MAVYVVSLEFLLLVLSYWFLVSIECHLTLLHGDDEQSMRTTTDVIHFGGCCRSVVASSFHQLVDVGWTPDGPFRQIVHPRPVRFQVPDFQFAVCVVWPQQVTYIFIVDLQE